MMTVSPQNRPVKFLIQLNIAIAIIFSLENQNTPYKLQPMDRTPLKMSNTGTTAAPVETAVPTLKVMRLQKPELHMPTAGTLQTKSLLGTAMCLPDSFGVIHVGETFTAYLGALNVSRSLYVGKLTVNAQLQTPSQRWHLASPLDKGNAEGGVELPPESGVDAIVSHALEEPGQHILRVEVGYAGSDGSIKALRKFYRFQVSSPLVIENDAWKVSGSKYFVSVSLNNTGTEQSTGMTTTQVDFLPVEGLQAERIDKRNINVEDGDNRATTLFDSGGRLEAGGSLRHLFCVTTVEAGGNIPVGSELGFASVGWRKACGETGRLNSSSAIAQSMASAKYSGNSSYGGTPSKHVPLNVSSPTSNRAGNDQSLISVQPVDPPTSMTLGVPSNVQFRVINHSDREMALQLEFESRSSGLRVCGSRSKSLDIVSGKGGSSLVTMRFLPLASGLVQIDGCNIVDLDHAVSYFQPPLCQVLVQPSSE